MFMRPSDPDDANLYDYIRSTLKICLIKRRSQLLYDVIYWLKWCVLKIIDLVFIYIDVIQKTIIKIN